MKRTHKRCLLFTFVLLVIAAPSFSQTLKEFFKNKAIQLTYLGIDFTSNLIIDDPDANPSDITARLYSGINSLVVKEQGSKNYDIGAAFGRKNVISIDTNAVASNNAKIDSKTIMSSVKSDFKRLKETDIANCVQALPLETKEGIGLVFIMEGMKKAYGTGYGAIWITLIDMKTKQVLMTKRTEHEALGFGFKNYWVSVIRKTIVEIDWSKYSYWKKEYTR
jgi:hypothetical protein